MLNDEKYSHTLIVTGGGTGGHINAGISLAKEFLNWFPSGRVFFIGADSSLEEKLVPRAGIPLIQLKSKGLKGKSIFSTLHSLILIPLAVFKSFQIARNYRPQFVIGVGGFVSGPCILGIWLGRLFGLLDCKIGILEQNAVPGLTNRLLSWLADSIYCAFPGMEGAFSKISTFSGNPIRHEFIPGERRTAAAEFNVLVFGGSQGAVGVNRLVIEALEIWKSSHLHWETSLKLRNFHRVNILFQTGEKNFESVVKEISSRLGLIPNDQSCFRFRSQETEFSVQVSAFVYDMPDRLRESHVVISRAGSSSLSEIARMGRASILIPFPAAADDHQTKNAALFTQKGAAKMLIQGKSTGGDLVQALTEIVENREIIEAEVLKFAQPDSAKLIINHLTQV